MDITSYRSQIDSIDNELVCLFCRRMELSARIAEYKKANGLPIYVPAREQKILEDVAAKAGAELAPSITELFTLLFRLSKDYQAALIAKKGQ